MNVGILGSGAVGDVIGTALVQKGHRVMMGSRQSNNEKGKAWVSKNGNNASQGTFEEAARHGEIVFLCLNGDKALEVFQTIDKRAFDNKLVIDVTNPLDFSRGMPPSLINSLSNNNSLGEEIQKLLPKARVVKALNTVTANLMVDPSLVNNGDHDLFICGNDKSAKTFVSQFLSQHFGWKTSNILDLGDITSARTTEGMVPFWVRLMIVNGSPMFNFKVVK